MLGHSLRQTQHREPEDVESDACSRCALATGGEAGVDRETIDEGNEDTREEVRLDTWLEIENAEQAFDRILARCAAELCCSARCVLDQGAPTGVELEERTDIAAPELSAEPLPQGIDGKRIVLSLVRSERCPFPDDDAVRELLDEPRQQRVLVAKMVE